MDNIMNQNVNDKEFSTKVTDLSTKIKLVILFAIILFLVLLFVINLVIYGSMCKMILGRILAPGFLSMSEIYFEIVEFNKIYFNPNFTLNIN